MDERQLCKESPLSFINEAKGIKEDSPFLGGICMSRKLIGDASRQHREIVYHFIYRITGCDLKALFSVDEINVVLGFPIEADKFVEHFTPLSIQPSLTGDVELTKASIHNHC